LGETEGHRTEDYKEVGVIGQIIPWNFPLMMLAWKVAPALAMGNTVVLKPAEYTSLTALLFAEICEKVGLPKVFFQYRYRKRTVAGTALVNHKDVNKVAFTGSTNVGKIIRREIAGSGKKSLELGGNHRSSFLKMRTSILRSKALWMRFGLIKVRFVAPVQDYWFRKHC
jgi:acyl-CoA reductase-like NAD-dependent aldehyde dehydrogenase